MDYYLAIKGKEILFGAKYRTREYYVKQKRRCRERKFPMFCPYQETKIKLKLRVMIGCEQVGWKTGWKKTG